MNTPFKYSKCAVAALAISIGMVYAKVEKESPSEAQKIGFVDSVQIMKELFDAQDANRDMQMYGAELKKKFEDRRRELMIAQKDYEEKKPMLSAAAREKEDKKLESMMRDLEAYAQECEKEYTATMQKINDDLMREITAAARDVAYDQGFDAIVDNQSGRVIYSTEKLNVTQNLVDRMNKDHTIRMAQSTPKKDAPTKVAATPENQPTRAPKTAKA